MGHMAGAGEPVAFARAVSERAESEVSNVYADIHVSTGLIEQGIYEIKVVAADAEEYLYRY